MEKRFWITTSGQDTSGDVIYGYTNRLRIHVSRLDAPGWSPSLSEVQIYGCIGAEQLVFETINIRPDDAVDMAAAVRWYAAYIGRPEMLLLTQEPQRLMLSADTLLQQKVNGSAAHETPMLYIVK